MNTNTTPRLGDWTAEKVNQFLEHEQGDPRGAFHALERQLNILCAEDLVEALRRARILAEVCELRATSARSLQQGKRWEAARDEQQRADRLRRELAELRYYEKLGF